MWANDRSHQKTDQPNVLIDFLYPNQFLLRIGHLGLSFHTCATTVGKKWVKFYRDINPPLGLARMFVSLLYPWLSLDHLFGSPNVIPWHLLWDLQYLKKLECDSFVWYFPFSPVNNKSKLVIHARKSMSSHWIIKFLTAVFMVSQNNRNLAFSPRNTPAATGLLWRPTLTAKSVVSGPMAFSKFLGNSCMLHKHSTAIRAVITVWSLLDQEALWQSRIRRNLL